VRPREPTRFIVSRNASRLVGFDVALYSVARKDGGKLAWDADKEASKSS
jgi:hypothetical protein